MSDLTSEYVKEREAECVRKSGCVAAREYIHLYQINTSVSLFFSFCVRAYMHLTIYVCMYDPPTFLSCRYF